MHDHLLRLLNYVIWIITILCYFDYYYVVSIITTSYVTSIITMLF